MPAQPLVGVESTIVRINENKIEILRQGAVSRRGSGRDRAHRRISRRRKKSWLPVKQQVIMLRTNSSICLNQRPLDRIHTEMRLICWGPIRHDEDFSVVRSLSETRDLRVAAQRLFSLLREVDRLDVQQIFIEPVPEIGLGKAIMNRIRRATASRPGDMNP